MQEGTQISYFYKFIYLFIYLFIYYYGEIEKSYYQKDEGGYELSYH